MPAAPKIEVDYEKLEQTSSIMTHSAETLQDRHRRLREQLQTLEQDGWSGSAAQMFFEAVQPLMLALERLYKALEDGSYTAKQIRQDLEDAEYQAGQVFNQVR